jgi:hypothetical protein
MPTASDLVTDLPADFEVFGQAVDTSLADLKGGTTGQVLSKATNADMDFTWVTSDDANAIQNTIVDAKGDLISATGSDVPARLAVGANGETLVADSSTSTGLRYIPYMSNNYAINGNFDIWQRGTSFPTQGVYTADRWYNTQSANITGSQQTSGAPDGSRYYFRQTATSTGGYYTMSQVVETANASQLWGKTVTFSVKLKRNATYNAQVQIAIQKNASVDASPSTTWTAIATKTILSTDISTSDWTTFLVTATIPNDGTANSVMISQYYLTNPANGSTLDLAQFQLEIGSAVTSFRRSGGTIQGELAACQRYYWRISGQSAAGNDLCTGWANSTVSAVGILRYPITMRVAPTFAVSAMADFGFTWSAGTSTISNLNPDRISVEAVNIRLTTTGLTTGQGGGMFVLTGTTKYLEASAEL